MASKLSLADRSELQAAVGVPTYRRDQISSGVVHIGVGSFHRAYQAAYLDDFFNRGTCSSGGIVGAGVRPSDAAGESNEVVMPLDRIPV
ncbi:MAG: hypothetical protein ACR2Q4_12545 [Geminicoccaceae bacterium]